MSQIKFTDNAALKVKSLIEEEGNPQLKLRVYITGGGCSGFQYGFTFDESQNEDDMIITNQEVSLLIDATSFQYLVGAEIDYKSDINGEQFIIRNPNAKTLVAVAHPLGFNIYQIVSLPPKTLQFYNQ